MSSRCNFCDHGNPPGAKYCNDCGSPLNFKPCTDCGAVNEVTVPINSCYKCGAKFPDEDTGIEDGRGTAPTANVGTLATSDRGLAQVGDELQRTATLDVSQSAERDVPYSIDGSVDLFAHEQHSYLTSFRSPADEAAQASPVLVPQRNDRRRLRVRRLTLPLIIAATAAVAGYVVHGFSTGDDNKAHFVATPEGRTTTGSINSVPSHTTDPSIELPGNTTTSADARNGGGSPVTQARIGATTISESEHEDTSTAIWNTPRTGSAAGDAASSVETPIPAADSDARHTTVGDAKSRGQAAPTGVRHPAGRRATTKAPSAFSGADAPGVRPPVRSADRDIGGLAATKRSALKPLRHSRFARNPGSEWKIEMDSLLPRPRG